MKIRRWLSVGIALCMILSVLCMPAGVFAADGDTAAVSASPLYRFSGDTHGFSVSANADNDGNKASLVMSETNARMFGKTLQYNITPIGSSGTAGASQCHCTLAEQIAVGDYDYVNIWVYSNKIQEATASGYNATLNLLFNDIGYAIPINWDTGWKLISIPTSSFAGTFPTDKITKISLTTNYQGAMMGRKWKESGTLWVDYIYLSKGAPPQMPPATSTTSVTGNNIEKLKAENDGASIPSNSVVSFTFDNGLTVDSAHRDKVIVKKGDTRLTSGYTTVVDTADNTKLMLVFDEPLEEGASYSVELEDGAVYDVYGYPTKAAEEVEFTVGRNLPKLLYRFNGDASEWGQSANIDADGQASHERRLSVSETNARMFDSTLKYSVLPGKWANNANCGASTYNATLAEPADVKNYDYDYVNIWVYSNTIQPTTGAGDAATLNLIVNDSIGYAIPINWNTGWKLVSIPTSSFKAAFPTDNIKKVSLSTNYTSASTYNGQRWTNGGEVLVDYIYLSKGLPTETNTSVTGNNIEELKAENGGASIPSNSIVSFSFDSGLTADSAHADKVIVKKGDTPMTSGYTLAVDTTDNTKLKLAFDEPLEEGASYSVKFEDGAVYDLYGYPTKAASPVKFTVGKPKVYPPKPLYQFSGDTHGLTEKANGVSQDDTKGGLTMIEENARMFGKTLQCSVVKGGWTQEHGNYGQLYYWSDLTPISTEGYKYVNAWIYSDNLPQDASGNPSTLTLRLQDNIGYAIPIDWDTGWKLVSIPAADFTDGSGAKLPDEVTKIELTANYTAIGGKRWASDGEVLVDYIYFSENGPVEENVTISGDNLAELKTQDNKVPVNSTIIFTAEREILPEAVHADKVTVKLDGTTVPDTCKIEVDPEDNTKIKLVFDGGLIPDTDYSITLGAGAVYDTYGNPNNAYNELTFTTAAQADDPYILIGFKNITKEENTVKAAAWAKVFEETPRSFVAILAQYDENGNLLDVYFNQQVVSKENGFVSLSCSKELLSETASVKAMIWDSLQDMKPYAGVNVFNLNTNN